MTVQADNSGVFVAAHELKTPLAIMRQLALALDLAKDNNTREEIQTQLVNVAERALRQVEDLTKIAQLERNYVSEPVCVRAICDGVLRDVTPFFQQTGRRIRIKYVNKARLAVANRELLGRVVYNFCTNAAKYSDEESESYLIVQDREDKVRVRVRDFGPALPNAVWREMQAGAIEKPLAVAMRPGSSGLGLYIVSQFARLMQAQFGAIRHRDGVSLYIDLPVSRQLELAFK